MHADLIDRQAAIDALTQRAKFLWDRFHEPCNISGMIDAIDSVPSAQPEQRWHPFTSAYGPDPKEPGTYLLTREGKDSGIRWVEMRYYNGVYFETGDFINKMIAWAEVPDPYRGDQ